MTLKADTMAIHSAPWLHSEPVPTLPWLFRASKTQVSLVAGAAIALVVGSSMVLAFFFIDGESGLRSAVVAATLATLVSTVFIIKIWSCVSAQQQTINSRLASVMKQNEDIRRALAVIRSSPESGHGALAINNISQRSAQIDSLVLGILRQQKSAAGSRGGYAQHT